MRSTTDTIRPLDTMVTAFIAAVLLLNGSLASATSSLIFGPPVLATAEGQARPSIQVVVGYGEIQGKPAKVRVIVAPRPGADPATVAARVLEAFHASATPPAHLVLPPNFVWEQFYDRSRRNNVVTQYYNPDGDPTGGAGLAALQRAQATWGSVKGSSFRFVFGGTTTRCPSTSRLDCTGAPRGFEERFADGFNDIAWVPIAPLDPSLGIVLASLTHRLHDANGHEIDIILNRDISPYAWFDDGINQIDLERHLLLLEGWAMGQNGSLDPDSVMYVIPDSIDDPIKRTLSATDEYAVVALYPEKPSLLVDTPSAHNFSLLAKEGDSAPGGGKFRFGFQAGAVNSRGDVAFVSVAVEEFPIVGGEGLFVSSSGGRTTLIVRSGNSFAGIPLGEGSLNSVGLNDAGDTAFCWLVGPFEAPFGVNGGLFRAQANGLHEALVLPGVTPAPGGGVFVGCYEVSLSNGGEIAFTGWVQRGSGALEEGAFLRQRDGTIVRIAGNGDPAPGGGVFSSAAFPRVSPNGQNVAFDATLAGAPEYGVWVRHGSGAIELIVRPGDPAPGGGAILNAFRPRVNNRGDILYAAYVPGLLDEPSLSLFLAPKGRSSQAIARQGDLLPDGYRFESLVSSLNSWTLNDNGEVAFAAHVQSPPVPLLGFRPTTSIYASSHDRLRFVAREGSIVGGLILESVEATPSPAIIDAQGDVVFGAINASDGLSLLLRAGAKAGVK